jgi:hypothetical protein
VKTLGSLEELHLDMRSVVAAEYIFVCRSIDMLANATGTRRPMQAWLMDPHQTKRDVAPYFERLMAYAKAPASVPPPDRPRFVRQKFGWWAYNPVGKATLQVAVMDLAPQIGKFEEEKSVLKFQARALRARVESLGQRSPPPSGGSGTPVGD